MNISVASVSSGLSVGNSLPVTLVGANENRETLIVHNQQYVLYVKCGRGAGPFDFTYRLTSNSTLELKGYIGVVTAVASQNSTYVRVTELV